jgi:hypothetical protein
VKIYRGFQAFLDRSGTWVAAHPNWSLALISLIYWLTAGAQAAHKLFWYDELTTWHIARLSNLAAIWATLHNGVDLELPLVHLSVRLSQFLFGPGHLATRIPVLFGFWVLALSLYILLKRHVSTPYALAGMIFPMLTLAWAYAIEARAYGMMLGAAALALACWQSATSGSPRGAPRWLALVGITAGLAAALLTHSMSVLLAIPFAAGEVVRSIERRRVDFPVWIAFAAAAPAVLIYPGLMAVTRGWDMSGMHPSLGNISAFYSVLLGAAISPLLVAGLVAYLAGREEDCAAAGCSLPAPLKAALISFIVLPAVFIAVATVTRQFFFVPRYGLLAVIGVAALVPVLACNACGGSRRSGAALLLVLVGWIVLTRGRDALSTAQEPSAQFAGESPLLHGALRADLPVVVADPLTFLQADFYLPEPDARRVHYLLDPEGVAKLPGQDIVNQLVRRLPENFSLRGQIEPYAEFVRRNPRFLILVDVDTPRPWFYGRYLNSGVRLTVREKAGDQYLFEVDMVSSAPPR